MKYAITGPAGRVFRIVEEEPTNARHYQQITDEQAQTIADGEGAFFVVEGNFVSQDIAMNVMHQKRMAERLAEQFAIDPDGAKDQKRQELATARYNAVEGGTTFNGIKIRTDKDTRNELATARQFAKDDHDLTIQWKLGNGQFITLDSSAIIAMADVVLAHQQAQFAKEKLLNDQITTATTLAEMQAITW